MRATYAFDKDNLRGASEENAQNERGEPVQMCNVQKGDGEFLASTKYKTELGIRPVGVNGDAGNAQISRPFVRCNRILASKVPWDVRKDVRKAIDEAVSEGRALLLENLDPVLNSSDVEGMLEDVLETSCDARVLPPRNISCYKSAEAVVVFRKKEIAERVLQTLTENILVMSRDDRPMLASLLTNRNRRECNLHGFFKFERYSWILKDYFDQSVVATSHCAQDNTVEYDMGILWRILQERSALELLELEKENETTLKRIRGKY